MKKNRSKISATVQGLIKARKALTRHYETQLNLAKNLEGLVSRSTIQKFFKPEEIQVDKFKEICKALKIDSDWEEIAGLNELPDSVIIQNKETPKTINSVISYKALSNPKFSLIVEELADGAIYRRLLEVNTHEEIWKFIQFPVHGYSTQVTSFRKQLIISNFGGSSILFFRPEHQDFSVLELDSYEAGNLAILSEKKKFGEAPVIRKYPPGDIIVVNEKLFISQIFSDFVVVVDLNSKLIVKRIPIGGEGKFAYCSLRNELYYTSNKLGVLSIIDPNTYEVAAIQYPEAWLHIETLFCHPESTHLYLGLDRTAKRDQNRENYVKPSEANSFIAIYDPLKGQYISQIELAIDETDKAERCWASSISYEARTKLLYIGMLGSPKNIYLINTEENKIVGNAQLEPNYRNKHEYVDSLSLALYKDYLLSVNRSNYELAVINRNTMQQLMSIPLGGTGNGPRHIYVHNDQAYISHGEYNGIIAVDLEKLINLLA
jgi:hypothetical protein